MIKPALPHSYLIILIVLLTILLVIYYKFEEHKNNNDKSQIYRYQKVAIMTENEIKFQKRILKYIPNEYGLHSQVSFTGFLKPKQKNKKSFYFISAKRADWIITDSNFIPIIEIELDDKSHDSGRARKSDYWRDQAILSSGIIVLRFRQSNSDIEIKRKIDEAFKQIKY